MNRRELFKIVAPGVVVAASNKEEIEFPAPDYNHRGFDIRWDGWVKPSNRSVWIGQWVACREGCWSVYSSYPGVTEKFFEGAIFNTSVQKNQEHPKFWGPDSNKSARMEEYKRDAFERLIVYIDKNYEELTHGQA